MEETIWVEIETTKSTDEVWTFKGQMQKVVFDGIVSNRLASGYLKLDKVYWIAGSYDENGNRVGDKLFEYGEGNKLKAYRGDMYLKIENLVSISPIDVVMDKARVKKPDEKHLSLVSPIKP